ncbi:MAG: glycosyltransferase [Chitinophagaceae bacterium]|nr:MAG: glycosyltransferase [Chitinophagaceae bacterium]
MHNLTKIKIFRCLLWITYPVAVLLIYPFVFFRKKNKSHLFFFFDRYAIGGAQRIHLDILKSVEDIPKMVFFTRESPNDGLKDAFYSVPATENFDIHIWCDYLLFRLFSVHYFSFYLNRHKRVHVLSSNSTFFYDMLPYLNEHVHKTELLHNFSYGKKGMEFFGLANYRLLNSRIVYDSFTLSNIHQQYAAYKVPAAYNEKILFIQPGVEVPDLLPVKSKPPLNILYAGRGGPQKRVWLVNRIARHFINGQAPVRFQFAGPLSGEIDPDILKASDIHGEVKTKDQMNRLYSLSHIIILTSAYEGFPMVIKEGMAYGCVPLVTALEGNKMHLKSGYNSVLIDEFENEEAVVKQAVAEISRLLVDDLKLQELGATAHEYAKKHFNKSKFLRDYHAFLMNTPAPL